jgi:hypothetical protein
VKQSVGDGIVMNGSGDYINSPTLSYDVGLWRQLLSLQSRRYIWSLL